MSDLYLVLTKSQVEQSVLRQLTKQRTKYKAGINTINQRDEDDYCPALTSFSYRCKSGSVTDRKLKKQKEGGWEY